MKQTNTPYQSFTTTRKALQAKLAKADITVNVIGKWVTEYNFHTDSHAYTAKLKDGTVVESMVAPSKLKDRVGCTAKFYTTTINGVAMTTDTGLVRGHGYGYEAALIWLDLQKAYKANQIQGVQKAFKGMGK